MNDIQEDYTYAQEEQHQGVDQMLLAVRKRLWLILTLVFIVAVLTYFNSSRTKPIFQATAKVLIERYNPQVIKVDEVMPDDIWGNDYYPTQYEILQSVSLVEEVVKKLDLQHHPEFNPEPKKSWIPFNVRSTLASVVRTVMPREKTESGNQNLEVVDDPLRPYVGAYLRRLHIIPVRNSRLVNISFEGHDPALAARIANAHAQAYIDKTMDMKISASQEAVGWLGGRLDELKQSLQESKENLQRFVEKEDIVTLENILSASGGGAENILSQKLSQLNSGLADARTERIDLGTRYQQSVECSKIPALVESIPDVVKNPIVQRVKGDLIELKRQYAEHLEKYGEKHPRMSALRQEMKSLQSRLDLEVQRITESVKMQYEAALAREQSLAEALDQTKNEVQELNKKAIQYGVLKQEVESNREMFEMIMKRAKETSLTSALKSTNIFIVDEAKVPRTAIRPRVRRDVLLTSVVALALGLGLTLLMEYLDHTFHGPMDMQRYLGIPFLGSVGLAAQTNVKGPSELLALEEPRSSVIESLRTVRTNVLFSLVRPGQKTLLVTSPGPLEGKTFLTSNLALIIAQMGHRVLLVDADLRKPRLHKIFSKSSKPGLSALILGECTLCDAVRDTQVKSLKLLPAGDIPPNPSEILGSQRMKDFLARVTDNFDFIIFDSTPVLSVTDGSILSGMLDGTIFVLKAGETRRGNAIRAVEQLKDTNSNVLGAVLNQVDFRKERYYYTYDTSYYYAQYGQGSGQHHREAQAGGELLDVGWSHHAQHDA
jgi:succinoglycan biosynthesis transport protein ExoP